MVRRNHHRAGRRKRERIATLQRRPTIIAVEIGHYIADQAKRQLRQRGENNTSIVLLTIT